MRVVLQIVQEASVTINDQSIAQIGRGFLLLVGFHDGDNETILEEMARKISGLRVFPDEKGYTNLSLADVNGEMLSVSQFTLYADTKKGRRPSFVEAMRPEKATVLYERWLEILRDIDPHVQTGLFGADMKVHLINDGPFTLILDSETLGRKEA